METASPKKDNSDSNESVVAINYSLSPSVVHSGSFPKFALLPEEIQGVVFSFLDHHELLSMRRVSKSCKERVDEALRRKSDLALVIDYPMCFGRINTRSALFRDAKYLVACFCDLDNPQTICVEEYCDGNFRRCMENFGRCNQQIQNMYVVFFNSCKYCGTLRSRDDHTLCKCDDFIEIISSNVKKISAFGIYGYLSNALVGSIMRKLGQKLISLSLSFAKSPHSEFMPTHDMDLESLALLGNCGKLRKLKIDNMHISSLENIPSVMLFLEKMVFLDTNRGAENEVDATFFVDRMPNLKCVKIHSGTLINVANLVTRLQRLEHLTLSVCSNQLTAFATVLNGLENHVKITSSITSLVVKHPSATSKLLCTLECHLSTGLTFTPCVPRTPSKYDLFCRFTFPLLRRLELAVSPTFTVDDVEDDYCDDSAVFPVNSGFSKDYYLKHVRSRSPSLCFRASEDLFLRALHFFGFCTSLSPTASMLFALFSPCDSAMSHFNVSTLKRLWSIGWNGKRRRLFHDYMWQNSSEATHVADGSAAENYGGDNQSKETLDLHLRIVIKDKKFRFGDQPNVFVFEVLRALYWKCSMSFPVNAEEICERKCAEETPNAEVGEMDAVFVRDVIKQLAIKRKQLRSQQMRGDILFNATVNNYTSFELNLIRKIAEEHNSKYPEKLFDIDQCVACGTIENFFGSQYVSEALLNEMATKRASLTLPRDIDDEVNPHELNKNSAVSELRRLNALTGRVALFGKLFGNIVVEYDESPSGKVDINSSSTRDVSYVISVKK